MKKISVFKSLFKSKETPFDLTIQEVVSRIKIGTPDLINRINIIRSVDKKDPLYSSTKKELNAIMFNGTFSERSAKGLIEHSEMCILDFDGYPSDEIMNKERQRLIDDPYVIIVFTSPGGNGLKAVIRIPSSTAVEHKRRFIAYSEYFKSEYFDIKNQDVSRVCFESYDSNIYFNEFCQVFEGITQDKGFEYVEKAPVCILQDENKKLELIEKFNFKSSFTDGSRNHFIFELACCL
ncbi:MAG: BT4734/BF3469 family protein, partial [Candidatus Paceibacterota bacterium]